MTGHEAELDHLARVLLEDALAERATDVHLNPTADGLRVRYRVDGLLRTVRELPATLRDTLPNALMRLGGSAGDGGTVRDGRIRLEGGQPAEFRLSILPSVFGPNVVLRALDLRPHLRRLDELGMAPDLLEAWRSCLHMPAALLVVTGPTGCGKTTTLYASLLETASAATNTLTIEQPVECLLDWTVQTPVTDTLPYASALRGILTQDPDIVLCGEVRDAESAKLLCEIGMTGHLVLAAMHTPDAPEVLARLVGIGLPAVLVGSSVQAVLAQRLVRKVCEGCRKERTLTSQERAWLSEARLEANARTRIAEGRGCDACGGTGFLGRTVVFHLLRPDNQARLVLSQCERGEVTVDTLRAVCVESSGSLRQNAFKAALAGVTTLQEAHWVTGG